MALYKCPYCLMIKEAFDKKIVFCPNDLFEMAEVEKEVSTGNEGGKE